MIIAYLFGCTEKTSKGCSMMPEGASVFEVEELCVRPEYRALGIGRKLLPFLECAVNSEAEFIMLSTASKNLRAIMHFYIDELDMEFWNARLFKRLKTEEVK